MALSASLPKEPRRALYGLSIIGNTTRGYIYEIIPPVIRVNLYQNEISVNERRLWGVFMKIV